MKLFMLEFGSGRRVFRHSLIPDFPYSPIDKDRKLMKLGPLNTMFLNFEDNVSIERKDNRGFEIAHLL